MNTFDGLVVFVGLVVIARLLREPILNVVEKIIEHRKNMK